MKISNKATNIIAFALLGVLFSTSILSMLKDALTFDELAHISAGYSYLTQQDYRLNPEHPPLAKDIAAIPLLFLNLNFPEDNQNWLQTDAAPAWWVQFDFGRDLLYWSENDPATIIFFSRLAMILLLLVLAWFIFYWTKKNTNNVVALGVLFLLAFSPTFVAHGKLANTDIGAVFGAFLSITLWLNFLKKPSFKNILLAALGFGVAQLFKFSLILLIPFFVILTVIYALLFKKPWIPYLAKALAIGLLGLVFVIWPIYQLHIKNYPPAQQLRDTLADISGHPIAVAKDFTIWLTQQTPFRALAQYFRGVLMASQRTAWGNTTYFLGKISASSWWYYFPLIFLLKVPLAFHLLTLIAIISFMVWHKRNSFKGLGKLIKENFWIVAFSLWIFLFWGVAILGNLNIGIRHLLPTFPFIYILVIFGIYKYALKAKRQKVILGILGVLFAFYATSSLAVFPHYLSYYNELAGGTKNGYKVAVDSNYDWGQDFFELINFMKREEIDRIYLDYFGGEDPEYWLMNAYVPLNPREIETPPKGWVAVSVNQLVGGIAEPVKGFDQEVGYYNWLKDRTPVAKIGHSIFIYRVY